MTMVFENIKMALISLSNAKLRSFLTMLGIIIGVSAVVSILAIGDGVKAGVESQITSVINSNAIAIASGSAPTSSKGKGGGFSAAASSAGASTLTEADVTALQHVAHVTAVAPISLVSGVIANGSTTSDSALLLATTPAFSVTQSLSLAGGRFLTTSDSGKQVVVLGGQAKTDLFGNASAVGKTITIRNLPFKVIGTLNTSANAASSLSGSSSFDDAVYMPFATAQVFNSGATPEVARILVQVDSEKNVNSTAGAIKGALLKTHGGQQDFTVETQADILSTVNSILSLLTSFIVAIASISLLVGGIGIMNIMLVSVTERTREIGLRKAIGASSLTVMSQFLIEAIVLSLIGGIVGILLAVVGARGIGHLAKITPVFTSASLILAVSVSAGVGIIFGIAPAIKAARKRPIQALKAE
jgi:putative ABC transport system permease protein